MTNYTELFDKIYATQVGGYGSGGGSCEGNSWPYERLIERLLKLYRPKTVLDLGCGDGQVASRIDWQGLSEITINPWWLAVATAVSLLTRYWFAEIWLLLLTRLGARLQGFRAQLFVVYSKAWLGRYIPGGAAWILR